jgi:predicted membrane channel-forming protein YqfA (hemolysin III family)
MASKRPTRIDLYTTAKVRDTGRRTRRPPNRTVHFIGAVIALVLAACLYLVGFREAVPWIGFLDVLVFGFFAGCFFVRSLKQGDW